MMRTNHTQLSNQMQCCLLYIDSVVLFLENFNALISATLMNNVFSVATILQHTSKYYATWILIHLLTLTHFIEFHNTSFAFKVFHFPFRLENIQIKNRKLLFNCWSLRSFSYQVMFIALNFNHNLDSFVLLFLLLFQLISSFVHSMVTFQNES